MLRENDSDRDPNANDARRVESIRARTQDLDRVLQSQRRRIRARFLIHGLGWIVGAVTLIGLFAFVLDYTLRVPALVRLALSLGTLVYLAFALRRRVLYPLNKAIGADDVALAVEQRFPELRQELITALQLGRGLGQHGEAALRGESAGMLERVVDQAAESARRLPLGELLSLRRTARVWAAAGAALAIAAIVVVPRADAFGVFLRRALGSSAEYPRRTHLFVELPEGQPEFIVQRDGATALVTLGAGTDLPVLVRAEGEIPREAFLMVEGGRGLPASIAMTQRPGERFRHVFRRVQGEFRFHARGGDDESGDLLVTVRAVEPPLVAAVDATLEFPAYTGLPPETRQGGAIEALAGTRVALAIGTTAPVVRAELRFVQGGNIVKLEPTRIDDDSGAGRRFQARFDVLVSDQYEIHLFGEQQLANPRPASYPILALEDKAPTGRVLTPSNDDVQVVVPTATLPLRLVASDDFGLAVVALASASGAPDSARRRELLVNGPGPRPREIVITELLAVRELGPVGGNGPVQGDAIALELELVDNRSPEAGRTQLPRRTVHIVDEVELMRRLAAQFRRVRADVESALQTQRERRDALEGLLESPPEASGAGRSPQLVALEVGQGRVLASCRRVREGLQHAFDAHLFNGLEGADSAHAVAAAEFWLRFHRETASDADREPAFYRALAEEQRAGRIGRMEKALDPLLDMTLRADRLVEELANRALAGLEKASIAGEPENVLAALTEVRGLQVEAVAELEALLARLDQWNEFQDVVQSARALRDAQRDIEYRTRSRSGEEKK